MDNKVSTYLGFAIKSNNIIYGIDNLKTYNKKLYLIILCHTANDKSITVAKTLKQNNKNCTVMMTKDITLSQLLHTDNCKMIGIKNHSLSQAIIDNALDILVGVN